MNKKGRRRIKAKVEKSDCLQSGRERDEIARLKGEGKAINPIQRQSGLLLRIKTSKIDSSSIVEFRPNH